MGQDLFKPLHITSLLRQCLLFYRVHSSNGGCYSYVVPISMGPFIGALTTIAVTVSVAMTVTIVTARFPRLGILYNYLCEQMCILKANYSIIYTIGGNLGLCLNSGQSSCPSLPGSLTVCWDYRYVFLYPAYAILLKPVSIQ